MKPPSVELQLEEYLERRYPTWVNGGTLERLIIITNKGEPAKPSNISRRLRELAKGKLIERDEKGSVSYRAKHGPIATINNIQVPVFKEKATPKVILKETNSLFQ